MLGKPFIKLRLVFLAVFNFLKTALFRRLHQAFIAENHRLNKVHAAAYDRKAEELHLVSDMPELFFFRVNGSVRETDGHCRALGSLHHDALNERLTADRCFMNNTAVFTQFQSSFYNRQSRFGFFRPYATGT